jgi:hypothetical protein
MFQHAGNASVSDNAMPSGSIAQTATAAAFGRDFSQIRAHAAERETIQAKMTVNQPGDSYEQEADRVADTVMSMPASINRARW